MKMGPLASAALCLSLALPALADDVPSPDGELHANACAPGTREPCTCPDGARGSRTCEWPGVSLSVCVCGYGQLPTLPSLPSLGGRGRARGHAHRRPMSGLGLLIAGSIVGAIGAGNLILGIERVVHDDENKGLFVFMIVHGGVCGAIGIPLAVVGSAYFGSRGIIGTNGARFTF
jgi:hypothetical protein